MARIDGGGGGAAPVVVQKNVARAEKTEGAAPTRLPKHMRDEMSTGKGRALKRALGEPANLQPILSVLRGAIAGLEGAFKGALTAARNEPTDAAKQKALTELQEINQRQREAILANIAR